MDRGIMTLLQAIAQRSAYWGEVKRKGSRDTHWKFKDNIRVYNNPQIKCCYCGEFIPTNIIWLIDTKELRVLKAWKKEGKNAVPLPLGGCHPHVGGGGVICMGNAQGDITAALFMGLNPNSAYHGVRQWLERRVDHCCWDDSERDDDEDDDERTECYHCGYRMDRDDAVWAHDDPYCNNCYHERFFYCEGCDDDIRTSEDEGLTDPNNGERLCTPCWNQEFFTCAGCDEETDRRTSLGETRDGQNFCNNCVADEEEE